MRTEALLNRDQIHPDGFLVYGMLTEQECSALIAATATTSATTRIIVSPARQSRTSSRVANPQRIVLMKISLAVAASHQE